jgi:alanine racemase
MTHKIEATIDLAALRHNLALVRSLAPASRVLAVVKADAYGHGLWGLLPALEGADALAVAHIDEALELREWSAKPIVVLEGFLDAREWSDFCEHGLTPVLHTEEQIAIIERDPPATGASAWIKLDTGMNRLGFEPGELPRLRERLALAAPGLELVLMTHLARADEPWHPATDRQIALFDTVAAGSGLAQSIANSGGIIDWPGAHRDWVRPGLMLYGIAPVDCPLPLRPVMTLRSRVIALRDVRAGEEVGYNGRWQASRDTRIATVSAGYADGYPTQLRDGTPVIIGGHEATLVGRPSMDMIMVDVGKLPQVRLGDSVLLWGDGLPATEIAACAGTLVYQLLTGVSKRVFRLHREADG